MSAGLAEADDVLALSGLQHLMFCERQAALIHVDRVWRDNGVTAEGNILHERTDLPGTENRRGVRVHRAVQLRCESLGIAGRADVVEYHADPSVPGGFRPFPVEYKRGRAKHRLADEVQLCAQGLCLEEMHGVAVPRGALYYGESHRRVAVEFDEDLRARTVSAAERLRVLIETGTVPRAEPGPKCRSCSLEPLCLPNATSGRAKASVYLSGLTMPRGEE
ncbi:MAG: CRISPR-associated protein Cas4 [Polyangiaceae bacterium]